MKPGLMVVIGDAAIDVQVAPTESMRPGGDVPAVIGMRPGGQGANVAVRLARRGLRVRLVTAIGDDAGGDLVRQALAADHVELREVPLAGPTSSVVVVLDATGERTMLSQRASLFGPAFEPSAIVGADWLVISGYALLEPIRALSMSGPTPLRVVLGCSLGPAQAAAWRSAADSIGPHLVILSRDEAEVLQPGLADLPSMSRELRTTLGAIVVVTHTGGAAAWVDEGAVEVAAPEAERIVDTTGAGDAFAATLVAGLVDVPWPPSAVRMRRAMAEASAVATAVVGVAGAQGRIEGEP